MLEVQLQSKTKQTEKIKNRGERDKQKDRNYAAKMRCLK